MSSLCLLAPSLQTVYLGPGDRHETDYDSFEQSSRLRDLDAFSIRDHSYTGLPLAMGGCQYSLRVYPSSDMEDDYITSKPITFTVTAVLIFVFTSVVFFFYDVLVERRQKKVMTTGKLLGMGGNVEHDPMYSQLKKRLCSSRVFGSGSVNCYRLLAVSIKCARPIVPC
jgi:hypothetical protein